MTEEVWMDCLGLEGRYQVSSAGRVKSLVARNAPALLSCYSVRGGYTKVNLWMHGKKCVRLVHTLVDEAFRGPRVPGLEVNHKDGNKQNPALANLERVTRSQNIRHARAMGLNKGAGGSKNGRAKVDEATVASIRQQVGERPPGRLPYGLTTRLAAQHGLSLGAMSHILKGRCWKSSTTHDQPTQGA